VSAELSRRVETVVAYRHSARRANPSGESSRRRCSTPTASRTCRRSGDLEGWAEQSGASPSQRPL